MPSTGTPSGQRSRTSSPLEQHSEPVALLLADVAQRVGRGRLLEQGAQAADLVSEHRLSGARVALGVDRAEILLQRDWLGHAARIEGSALASEGWEGQGGGGSAPRSLPAEG